MPTAPAALIHISLFLPTYSCWGSRTGGLLPSDMTQTLPEPSARHQAERRDYQVVSRYVQVALCFVCFFDALTCLVLRYDAMSPPPTFHGPLYLPILQFNSRFIPYSRMLPFSSHLLTTTFCAGSCPLKVDYLTSDFLYLYYVVLGSLDTFAPVIYVL
jgi:hypothetical protein